METIRDLFSKDIDQHIEEVIKVDQANEETVRGEIADYIVTDSIKDHFLSVYKAVADGRSEPHEGIGIWVSGFFGSGKSSFAKILGAFSPARLRRPARFRPPRFWLSAPVWRALPRLVRPRAWGPLSARSIPVRKSKSR